MRRKQAATIDFTENADRSEDHPLESMSSMVALDSEELIYLPRVRRAPAHVSPVALE